MCASPTPLQMKKENLLSAAGAHCLCFCSPASMCGLNLGLNRSLRVNALCDVAKETGPGAGTGSSANPGGVSMSSCQRQP